MRDAHDSRSRARGGIAAVAIAGILLLGALGGCATFTNTVRYEPPARPPGEAYRRTIAASYDTTWSALIDYASSTFFSIENFEKDSGLLIVDFGANDISRYVDCGTWFRHYHDPRAGVRIDFEGPYAAWLEQQNRGRLRAKMNIRVRPVDAHHTQVVVNARYVLTNGSGDRWVFSSGQSDRVALIPSNVTPGSPPTRTCQSTQRAERSILDAMDRIASRP